ncbi:flavin-dependent dehydrogenase [Caldisphaera lagunensis DSM 15908]|uniref:Flavin-dependent dehydrogenase n=1 Tax=Caldisphaera lagunensis (strain DSM 15908 / JCM 11604 / ANMR 0165 / IC-154) TaxID=1056495 RepID=L0A960_CALLD|nr:NAD(P)/FAD-dependent oxidoreductase [Caldisphaera lagunensis]AFZ70406.1 flavin-dependent dehydrogenase [Caldisphaera lagunensis DSM 15908]
MKEINIIGAGPAGAAAAYALSKHGYKVKIYEANKRLAMKPCGLGIPSVKDLPFKISKQFVLKTVNGVELYVDEKKVLDKENFLEGYIIDKENFLESLIAESGAEIYKNSGYNPLRNTVRENGNIKEVKEGIIAGGFSFYNGEKINAIQTIAKSKDIEDLRKLIIFFDTEIIGYYWIFPTEDGVEVGVGGYRSTEELSTLLNKFIKSNELLANSTTYDIKGAQIAVGGVDLNFNDNLIKIGEAAGFVLPLTGEGIRPSLISGIEAANAINEGKNVKNHLHNLKITNAIRIQRRILVRVKSMDRQRRRELLSSMPAEVHAEVALGNMNKLKIIKALASRPDLAIKLINYMSNE